MDMLRAKNLALQKASAKAEITLLTVKSTPRAVQ
jgi:hypothetical protein